LSPLPVTAGALKACEELAETAEALDTLNQPILIPKLTLSEWNASSTSFLEVIFRPDNGFVVVSQ
jgi:hypothetical protein